MFAPTVHVILLINAACRNACNTLVCSLHLHAKTVNTVVTT